jgi:hypothetical protein
LFLEDFAAGGLAVEDFAPDDLTVEGLAVDGLTAAVLTFEVFAVGALDIDVLAVEVLAAEVLPLDDFTEPRAVLADPRARFLGVLRLTAVVFPAPFEILFLRVFCDTACARRTLAPLFKIFP